MNLSFNIISYTNKHQIGKRQNANKFKPINESPFSSKVGKALDNIGKFFIGSCVVSFLLPILVHIIANTFGIEDIEPYLSMLFLKILGYCIMLTFIFYSVVWFINMIYEFQVDIKTEMDFHDLGEKIHFSDDDIKITSPSAPVQNFPYTDIQNLTLCFKEIDIPYQTQIAIFRWQHQTKTYQYTIEAEEHLQSQDLRDLLHYFYTNKIPIQEIDGDGKKTYMLNEEYKPKKPEIAPEIQSLIDEIGEDEKD